MMRYCGERYELRYDRERPGGKGWEERTLGFTNEPDGGPLVAAARAEGLNVRIVELRPTGNLA